MTRFVPPTVPCGAGRWQRRKAERVERPPHKPRQHFVYLSVHLSRPCGTDGSPLIAIIGLSHVEDAFCLYAASLLVKPRPIE
jgi:hypothetical protein